MCEDKWCEGRVRARMCDERMGDETKARVIIIIAKDVNSLIARVINSVITRVINSVIARICDSKDM